VIDPEGYAFLLKKDTWNEFEIKMLFDTDGSQLINLIRSSIAAKKLKPLGYQQLGTESESGYYFDPLTIVEFAIAKKITLPDELRDWYAKQSKPKPEEVPSYLDPAHPLHSWELAFAIRAWRGVLESNPDKPKTGSRKKLVEEWLKANHKELNQSQINRITKMLNPDKEGGAPKTE
jgi:hypothetical protein